MLLCALAGTALLTFAATDPVLMKINGKNVRLSEFEYFFNKNKQQGQPESVQDYAKRFAIFKQKVACAEDLGLDTTSNFKSELEGYKNQIVQQFLTDTTVRDRLVHEAYVRSLTNLEVDHIMLPRGQNKADDEAQKQRLDSIRTCIENGQDFYEMAKKFSVDPSLKNNNGYYGWIVAGIFPYKWEEEAYKTPVGGLSEPFATDWGYHLIRVKASRPDPGTVEVEHILVMFPRNATDAQKDSVKLIADSIYSDVTAGGVDFEQEAKAKSQDRSAANGGRLPRFGVKMMVPEFEEVAFALPDDSISKPFATAYGYHIVKKLHHYPVETEAQARNRMLQLIQNDERGSMPYQAKVEQMKKAYNLQYNNDNVRNFLTQELNAHGQYDSTFVADVVGKATIPIFTYKGISVPLKSIAKRLNPKTKFASNDAAVGTIMGEIEPYANVEVMRHYRDNLIDDNPDYRNLFNEYRDGSLYFDVCKRQVWDAAPKDTVGLTRYFEQHRAKYAWTEPRFKGIILSTKNDSVMNLVKAEIKALGGFDCDTLTDALYHKFSDQIKQERMLFKKGENNKVDALWTADAPALGSWVGREVNTGDKRYPLSLVIRGGVVAQPEDYADVKGLVTSDYTEVLMAKWEKELAKKYPCTINQQVLAQAAKSQGASAQGTKAQAKKATGKKSRKSASRKR